MVKLHVFHTGNVRVDQAIPLYERNPLAVTGLFRGKKKKKVLPVSCYLIEHPMGNILIDTGWDTRFAYERPREWFGIVDKISSPMIDEKDGIDSKLAMLGMKDTDIDAVYFSHLDFDHTSGVRLVRNAKAFYASREELIAAKKSMFRYVDTWSGIVKVRPFDYQETGIGPAGRSYDVFEDGSVLLVSIPGHSHGIFAVKISAADKYVILANDGAYMRESFEHKIIPGFTIDNTLAAKSLEWLCMCRKDEKCIEVLANRDPDVKEHVIEL